MSLTVERKVENPILISRSLVADPKGGVPSRRRIGLRPMFT